MSLRAGKSAAGDLSAEGLMQQSNPQKSAPSPTSFKVPPLPEGWQVVAYSVLSDGSLAIIGSDADLRHEWRRDAEGRVLGKPLEIAATASARIWVFDGAEMADGPTFPLLTPFPVFDRFPDGRWLIAAARKTAEHELDALLDRVLADDGREPTRLQLGDGIMHLKIDRSDRIWVGWFDEGVFGNDHWRVPGLEWPPSAYGLAAFDEAGAALRVSSGASPELQISDCYALNVVGDQAWACTYPGSPISMSNEGTPFIWWPTDLPGSVAALAIEGSHFLAAGGFGDQGNRVILGRLEQGAATVIDEWRLPFAVGYLRGVDVVDARADCVHVVVDGIWHVWRLGQFRA
jgi:hypothetical protein